MEDDAKLDFIMTAETNYDVQVNAKRVWTYWDYCYMLYFKLGRSPANLKLDNPVGILYAYVNYGRWICDCPYCKSAQVVSYKEPIFFCPECDMIQNYGHAMNIKFPRAYKNIEQLLLVRPSVINRNWDLGQSLKELERENMEHFSEMAVN